ncbi:DUF2079 domain-containing protein [Brachybacterium hainanense]|uniref:DUF2079 domain-containing protein n=1 Tax=Brachybacterium hainanense TaxID=1541174 RepID=A0ABV6REQ4_9MICO
MSEAVSTDPIGTPDPAERPSPWLCWAAPLAIAATATLLYGLLGVQQWRSLAPRSWDLGIFSELAKAYSRLDAPIVSIKGDAVNLLGDHFHPLLVVLGPVWALWPSGLALLWAQALLLGISAIPLTRLAIDRLGGGLGILAGVGYAFSFGLQAAADVQFHEIALAVPLLAFSLTALLRGRLRQALVLAGLLVFVKEDLGLTVAVLGGVIALRDARHRLHGAVLAAWGLGWFLLSTFVILPLLNTAGQYDYTGNLGSPLDVFFPAEKWMTVGMLLLAAGVIGARSPLIWLMVPTLGWRFTGTVEHYWTWYWHYNAVLVPIALVALLDALGDRRTGRATAYLATDAALRPRRLVQRGAVLASVAVTAILGGQMPIASLASADPLARSPRWDAAQQTMAVLPAGTTVASDITLMAYLVPGHDVQWTHGPNARVPDCVVIDRAAFSWSGAPPADPVQWAADTYQVAYQPLSEEGGFIATCRPEVL